jgi:uncharacterized membrane protein
MDNQPSSLSPQEPNQQESIFKDVFDTEPYEKSLKTARIWLYVIAGIQLLMGIIEYNMVDDKQLAIIVLAVQAFIGLLFLILGLWSKSKPTAAFTIALVLYLVFIIGFSILDPANILRGVIVKVLVVIALIKANINARKYEEIMASVGK